MPRFVVALSLAQIARERVLHRLGQADLHQHFPEMGPADGRAEALPHRVIVHRQPVGRHAPCDDPVALVPIPDHALQHRGDLRRGRIDIIAQNVHRPVKGGADLNARDHLHTQARPLRRRGGIAGRGVVVGDGDGAQAAGRGEPDHFLRRVGPVRFACMDVQVYLSHSVLSFPLFLYSCAHLIVRGKLRRIVQR